ncbi:hypothetical protein [Paraburkholderia sp.]|uniref:hypothetical protein n=1 Tax=Paraburkholderia sp. TaxID=1926495 RepID=UPI0039E6E730
MPVVGGVEKKNRLISWLTAWGGAASLVISIGTGVYTFYTNEIRKPAEERLLSFQTHISSINAVNQETQAKVLATTDPAQKMALINAANNQKYILVNEAERIFSEISDKSEINPYDLYVLASENSQMGRFDTMDKYIALADQNAKNSGDPVTIAAVMVWKGKAVLARMGPSGIEKARSYFDQAPAELELSKTPDIHFRLASLYGDMALIEAGVGDCDKSRQDKKKFDDEIAFDPRNPGHQNLAQVTQGMLASQQRCPML